jgi:hypothetical protein
MYTCNITGNKFDLNEDEKNREGGTRFGHNVRFRAICYVLSKMLYDDIRIITNLETNKNIKGIGMSDSGWADICSKKFNYINTFYHKKPLLDIYDDNHINNYSNLDFIISSDVFEHINPFPNLQKAFDNLYKMLKFNGFIVFSVPFWYDEYKEHYPSLYNYEIKKENNEYILYNTTIDGKQEIFKNLVFHGGPGSTLEMRIFSHDVLINYFKNAGFKNIKLYDPNQYKDMNKYGIFWENNHSLIISATK